MVDDIRKLPDACLCVIFDHLEWRDAVSLATTCRYFFQIGKQFMDKYYACKNCGQKCFHVKHRVEENFKLATKLEGALIASREVSEGIELSCNTMQFYQVDAAVQALITKYITTLFPTKYPDYASLIHEDILRHLHCKKCAIYLGFKLEIPSAWDKVRKEKRHRKFMRSIFNNFYTCKSFLDIVDYSGRKIRSASAKSELRCRKTSNGKLCNNVISSNDNVVSLEHNWDIPNSGRGIEQAMLLSGVEQGNILLSNGRREMLAQGKMFVEDMSCKACKTCIGWKFSGIDITCPAFCLSLVGRYGLICSAVLEVIASGDGYTLFADVGCTQPTDILDNLLQHVDESEEMQNLRDRIEKGDDCF